MRLAFLSCLLPALALATPAEPPPLPGRLSGTGLYLPGSPGHVDPANQPYTPQYPLWSDGTTKRRWLRLPPGTAIDASDPDVWDFPPGTRLWKEFGYGRPIETRYIERLPDGGWRFATYVWNEDGSDAVLAPEQGFSALPVADAPGGTYAIPSRADCLACHGGTRARVLGVSALQLSPDRDPLAPHADPIRPGDADLRTLASKGWLQNLPPGLLANPPRIAAATREERAALGYLHGNCGHCHNRDGGDPAVPVELSLAQYVGAAPGNPAQALAALLATTLHYRRHGAAAQPMRLISPGDADASVLMLRMRTRNPMVQMPPLGTRIADPEGLALIERWINHDLPTRKDTTP